VQQIAYINKQGDIVKTVLSKLGLNVEQADWARSIAEQAASTAHPGYSMSLTVICPDGKSTISTRDKAAVVSCTEVKGDINITIR
jgi:hypothetical protein